MTDVHEMATNEERLINEPAPKMTARVWSKATSPSPERTR